jgi:hypothetical protein
MTTQRMGLTALVWLTLVVSAFAQGNPTGGLSGQVIDAQGLPLPGATVTVESPVLQGTRTAVTSTNGDYIVPFLPPGDYTVLFELAGFQSQKQTVRVQMTETLPLNAKLAVSNVTETVEVRAQAANEIGQTGTVSSTYRADFIERLPLGRTIAAATLLAPVSPTTGPTATS